MTLPDPCQLAAILDVCKGRGPMRLKSGDFELVLSGEPAPDNATPEERQAAILAAAVDEATTPWLASGMQPRDISRRGPRQG